MSISVGSKLFKPIISTIAITFLQKIFSFNSYVIHSYSADTYRFSENCNILKLFQYIIFIFSWVMEYFRITFPIDQSEYHRSASHANKNERKKGQHSDNSFATGY